MDRRIFIAGVGIISALGAGRRATVEALERGVSGVKPLGLFSASQPEPLPVGEVRTFETLETVPRTHSLALIAAREALACADRPPDAIVLGAAGGGMSTTEVLLKDKTADPSRYRDHGAGTVAAHVARAVGCRGPVLTVSTACSSGSVAIAMAMEMIRSGRADTVLAGGADALCRLTYYGFHTLQLVDPAGARPLDRDRRGMTVGEGAAMLLLTSVDKPPWNVLCELLGAGLSCDAYHPAAPQPQGLGALRAMRQALDDAGAKPSEIDYIHLHGTGTIDNDLSEARALNALFGRDMPMLSSTKGDTGHTLGAAGAIGAAVAAIAVREGRVPANGGCKNPDPELNLQPVMAPLRRNIQRVLVNAFGFGGNNASLVIGHPVQGRRINSTREIRPFTIKGMACLTGAGDGPATMSRLFAGDSVKGVLDFEALAAHLPQRVVRRLKRLPRMSLTLASAAGAGGCAPHAVFFGTGWGPLSEAYDFLTKLYESGEKFSSPTDFIGSVHNAPAGQAAMQVQATGPNITLSGGDYSFEQALFTASLFRHVSADPFLLIGADEHHPVFSPLLEPDAARNDSPADGGAAFLLNPRETGGLRISCLFFKFAWQAPDVIPDAIAHIGGPERIRDRYAAVFFGMPAAAEASGRLQLKEFLDASRFPGPVVDYRRWTGEFASASAVATFMAAQCIQKNEIPGQMCGREEYSPDGRSILLLSLGDFVTAVEAAP